MIRRKAYVRKDGVRVKGTMVKVRSMRRSKSRSRSRSRKMRRGGAATTSTRSTARKTTATKRVTPKQFQDFAQVGGGIAPAAFYDNYASYAEPRQGGAYDAFYAAEPRYAGYEQPMVEYPQLVGAGETDLVGGARRRRSKSRSRSRSRSRSKSRSRKTRRTKRGGAIAEPEPMRVAGFADYADSRYGGAVVDPYTEWAQSRYAGAEYPQVYPQVGAGEEDLLAGAHVKAHMRRKPGNKTKTVRVKAFNTKTKSVRRANPAKPKNHSLRGMRGRASASRLRAK